MKVSPNTFSQNINSANQCLPKSTNNLNHCGNWNKCTDILTGPSDSDPMASSHSFLFSLSFLMSAFCSWESLYTSTFIFLGLLAGEVFEDSEKQRQFSLEGCRIQFYVGLIQKKSQPVSTAPREHYHL